MEEKDENVVEETTQETTNQVQEDKQPDIDLNKFESKDDPDVYKVDLSKSQETEEENTVLESEVEVSEESEKIEEEKPIVEEVKETKTEEKVDSAQEEETPVLEEITDQNIEDQVDKTADEAEKAISESMETGKDLPENIQKLVDFMEDTGGDINDYVALNQDYSEMDNHTLLKEYYKRTKPHLSNDEIDFLMEDSFSYDDEEDEERDIKRKKLALKEQVADAKNHLDGLKSKYYEDIKSGSKLTSEQQKAIEFFNRYNKESKDVEAKKSVFNQKTNEVFNDKFKGFEYNIGDKKFRFNVKDVNKVKENQSDINNFMRKFLDKRNQMGDAQGYHKSMFTAMNPDAIANHFYEQGKADALKQSVAKSKNINMDPRQQHGKQVNNSGYKFKVLGQDSSDFKLKIKNNK